MPHYYTGCIKRSGQSLWWLFRTLFGTKNPNTLFPNSYPFPSYATITHLSSLHSIAILSLSCSQLFVFSQLFSVSFSSCPYQFQRLARVDAQNVPLSHEHILLPADLLLHITQSALVYFHGSCVNLCIELLPASYFNFVHILLHAAPEKEVQWICLARQLDHPFQSIYLENDDLTIGVLEA